MSGPMLPQGLACPGCGKTGTAVGDAATKPGPGNFGICEHCGALLQFDAERRLHLLDQLPANLPEPQRILITVMQARVRGGDEAARWQLAAELVLVALVGSLKYFPRFAFPPKDVVLVADLETMAPHIAKNSAAREMIQSAIGECSAAGLGGPTVLMLRGAVEKLGLATEEVSLADLGLVARDGSPVPS